jgi:hypothetical protein
VHHPPHFSGRATVAVLTGFEPATSGLTGRRALQTAPQDQAVPAEAVPSFTPPTLGEWNRSLGVCNSVWARRPWRMMLATYTLGVRYASVSNER